MDECRELVRRLNGKSGEEIIGILGQPAHESGARKEERSADGVPWIVEIRRTLTYYDVGATIHRLIVIEQANGKCELRMSGREISDKSAP